MKIVGITGGVGSGKTQLLNYMKEHYNCHIVLADEVAHKVKEKGQACYNELLNYLGTDILLKDGSIDKFKMAEKIFQNKEVLLKVNAIIHPAVKLYIRGELETKKSEDCDFFFIEAALLIEAGYEEIVDEFWYIYAPLEERVRRLKSSRGYTEEKIRNILKEQLSEEAFRAHCGVVIDNSGSLSDAFQQIDKKLGEYL